MEQLLVLRVRIILGRAVITMNNAVNGVVIIAAILLDAMMQIMLIPAVLMSEFVTAGLKNVNT